MGKKHSVVNILLSIRNRSLQKRENLNDTACKCRFYSHCSFPVSHEFLTAQEAYEETTLFISLEASFSLV